MKILLDLIFILKGFNNFCQLVVIKTLRQTFRGDDRTAGQGVGNDLPPHVGRVHFPAKFRWRGSWSKRHLGVGAEQCERHTLRSCLELLKIELTNFSVTETGANNAPYNRVLWKGKSLGSKMLDRIVRQTKDWLRMSTRTKELPELRRSRLCRGNAGNAWCRLFPYFWPSRPSASCETGKELLDGKGETHPKRIIDWYNRTERPEVSKTSCSMFSPGNNFELKLSNYK